MSRHSFDPDIAARVGLNAAVIFQNIVWWCERNEANGRNIHEGRAWTYNSVSAFAKLFPYLTEKQIRSALDRLKEAGLILVDVLNSDPRDRTKWYAVAGEIGVTCEAGGLAQEGEQRLPMKAERFAPEGEPLPDNKPDNKPDKGAGAPSSGFKASDREAAGVLAGIVSDKTASDFVAHRRAIKKPLTRIAAERIVAKLAGHPDPEGVLGDSIMSGWSGVFPERRAAAARSVSDADRVLNSWL